MFFIIFISVTLPHIHPSICVADGAMERVFWPEIEASPEGYKKKFSAC